MKYFSKITWICLLVSNIRSLNFTTEETNLTPSDNNVCSMWDNLYQEHKKCLMDLAVLKYLNEQNLSSSNSKNSENSNVVISLKQEIVELKQIEQENQKKYKQLIEELKKKIMQISKINNQIGEKNVILRKDLETLNKNNADFKSFLTKIKEQNITLQAELQIMKDNNNKLQMICTDMENKPEDDTMIGSGFHDEFDTMNN